MEPVSAGGAAAAAAVICTDGSIACIIVNGLTGPGGLIILVAIVLYGAYLILVKHVLPQQEKHISHLLESAKEDRATFKEAFALIGTKLDKVTDRLEELEDKVAVVFHRKE